MAWLYLRRDGPEAGEARVLDGVRRLAAAKGAAGLYHETLTRFWVRVIRHVDLVSRPARFDDLLSFFPRLTDKDLPLLHYRRTTLWGVAARSGWVEPDLRALPRSGASSPSVPLVGCRGEHRPGAGNAGAGRGSARSGMPLGISAWRSVGAAEPEPFHVDGGSRPSMVYLRCDDAKENAMPRRWQDGLREHSAVRTVYGVSIAARVLGGYRLLKLHRRLRPGARDWERAVRRYHERGAGRVLRGVVRMQGLMIKIGQSIGSNPAAFPMEYISVLSRLQDQVPPRPWSFMRPALEDALGAPVSRVFAEFDTTPVGAASLAQVYRARLNDGRPVAVKVLYPGIERLVRTDLRLLKALLWLDSRASGYSLQPIYQELARNIPLEIDLVHEAQAMEEMAANLRDDPRVVIPGVVWEHTSTTVLVMDWIDGIKVTNVDAMRAAGIDVQAVGDLLGDCYCRQMLVHGFFHADPHPGNLFALPGNRIAIVDFGLTKRLTPRFVAALKKMSYGTFTMDEQMIIDGYREMGFAVRRGDGAEVFLATADFFRGLTDPGVYAAGTEAMQALNQEWARAVKRNPFVALPGDLTLVSRMFFLLTGVGVGMGGEPHVVETVLRYTADRGVAA
jgi:predicted unusual protein kinase regulating ubiquinone biosynthesis (AarF/ABC1/UbiB family)